MRHESTSHEDGPRRPVKRHRISRACGPCRYAKLKCNGQQPVCSTCAQLKKHCTYNPITKHRGLRPGYVRALEILWGLTFQELENAESVVDELLSRISKQDLATSSTRAEPDAVALPFLECWKQSSVSRHLDDLLEENEESNEEGGTEQSGSGPNTLQSVSSPSWEVIRKQNEDVVHRTPTSAHNLELPKQISTQHNPNFSEVTENFPLPPQNLASRLLQLFFSHGQSWLPILERHVILKTSFLAQRSSSQSEHGNLAALRGVYAYSTAVFGHLLDDEKARVYATQQQNSFYAQAFSMLPLDSEIPIELGHIQCILLLALTRLNSSSFTASRRLLRHTINMLHELDSHSERHFDREALAHAWLASFIIDTLTSACLHSKPLLCFKDVQDWCRIDENAIEEWQEWQLPARHRNNNMSPEMPSEIPTHSLSLLVLHVRLLHVSNESLHHQNRCQPGLEKILTNWDQDLSKFMSREGLTVGFLDQSLKAARLPPSFMSLSALYTFISTFVVGQNQESQQDNLMTTPDSGRSLLPHITTRSLKHNSDIYTQLPTVQLLFREWNLFGLDVSSDRSLRQSTPADPIPLVGEQGLAPSDIRTYQASPIISTVIDRNQTLGYAGRDPYHPGSSLGADVENYSMASIGQISDSSIPLFDTQLDTANAPFLEFLDGLDDRSVRDMDLFNKSLGYTF